MTPTTVPAIPAARDMHQMPSSPHTGVRTANAVTDGRLHRVRQSIDHGADDEEGIEADCKNG